MDFDYEGADDFGGRILWGRIGVFGGALLLALILGRCTAGGGGVPDEQFQALFTENASAKDALVEKDSTIAQLQQQLQDARTSQTGGLATPGALTGTEGTEAAVAQPGGATGTDAQGNRVYEVQPGDTLSTIAAAVYNDPRAFGIIASANNISGSSPLQVGQQLIIPPNPDAQ